MMLRTHFVSWQVNRDLMGVIESLQSQTEEMEENSEESSEGAGATNEKLDEIAEDPDICKVDSDLLQDVKKCISTASPEIEQHKTHQEKKADDHKIADVMNVNLELSPVKAVVSDNHELCANVGDDGKRPYKRKKASDDQSVVPDAGVKTRSRKAAKPAMVV